LLLDMTDQKSSVRSPHFLIKNVLPFEISNSQSLTHYMDNCWMVTKSNEGRLMESPAFEFCNSPWFERDTNIILIW
jgi:hypothetical protein